ncbi:ras gtpase-activating protein [Anaeramoeba flamelloides]|uniref:Ras gtpase-activating protein n=1 Tax=Anaeramoeba flamelloides TaxID=1746091 RepID=A0ABQ8Z997_9EUKA|nr:ras gtpase-activating protein [Anaeramoeba flamelloides]
MYHPELFVQVFEVSNVPTDPVIKYPQPRPVLYSLVIRVGSRSIKLSPKPIDQLKWDDQVLFLITNMKTTLTIKLIQHIIAPVQTNSKNRLLLKKKSFKNKVISIASINVKISSLIDELVRDLTIKMTPSSYKFEFKEFPKVKLQLHLSHLKAKLETKKEMEYRKHFNELVMLFVRDDYQILETFTDVVHSGLAEKVSQTIVNILREHGREIEFLNKTIDREVMKTRTPQQLFRVNSISTKMMSYISQTTGLKWLTSVIKSPVEETINFPEMLTLNKRITQGDKLKKFLNFTIKILENILNNVFNSINQMPIEFRKICYQLNLSVKKKFPKNIDISIAGFIFLRYVCPAIINPSRSIFLEQRISGISRKNLVYFAKIIQTFANKIQMGLKDRNLAPLKPWQEQFQPKFGKFVEEISAPINNKNENEKKKNKNKDINTTINTNDDEEENNLAPFKSLIDLRNYFLKFFNKIDTILLDKTEKTTFLSFLTAKDPSTELIIVLNELKPPPKKKYIKLHKVSYEEIKKKKAMIIVKHEDVFDYFKEAEEYGILNIEYEPQENDNISPIKLAQEMIIFFRRIYRKYQVVDELINTSENSQEENSQEENSQEKNSQEENSQDEKNTEIIKEKGINGRKNIEGIKDKFSDNHPKKKKKVSNVFSELKKKQSFRSNKQTQNLSGKKLKYPTIDWNLVEKDESYQKFIQTLGRLKKVNTENLNFSEKLSFWINISNSLLIHSCIFNKSSPETFYHLNQINSQFRYMIGDNYYSRDDITHGVLRISQKYFNRNDPRINSTLESGVFLPYIHFALSDLQISSPEIYTYEPNSIDQELLFATNTYLTENISIQKLDQMKNKLILPKLFQWNKASFGSDDLKVLNFVLSSLSISNPNLYKKIIKVTESDFMIEYKNIKLNETPLIFNPEIQISFTANRNTPSKKEHNFSFFSVPKTLNFVNK